MPKLCSSLKIVRVEKSLGCMEVARLPKDGRDRQGETIPLSLIGQGLDRNQERRQLGHVHPL